MKAVLFGAAAAFVAPWHLEGSRLKRLLGDPSATASDGSRKSAAVESEGAVNSANLTLRLLARIPGTPWKNTCLYRAVAGCLALRWLGGDATLRIGARRDEAGRELQAHAWIDGLADNDGSSGGFRVLTRGARTGS